MTAGFIFLALAALFAIGLLTAPEGYQDETGFHFGRVSVKRTSPTSAARAAEDGQKPRP